MESKQVTITAGKNTFTINTEGDYKQGLNLELTPKEGTGSEVVEKKSGRNTIKVTKLGEGDEFKGFTGTVATKDAEPTPVDPEITSVTITPEKSLIAPVTQDIKVASLSAEGGTPEITYTLEDSEDKASFKIDGSEIKAASELQAKEYKVKVKATDTKGKEKVSEETTITVSAPADPEITEITVTPEVGLEGTVTTGTKVASLSCTGGTADYTYTLAGGKDDAKFKISGTEVQAKEDLEKGTYTIKVKVTDSKQKEKTSDDVTITVDYKIYDIKEVFKVRGDKEQTFNKQIKELQQNIAYENTGKGQGKVTGTLLWVTDYTNPAYGEGNVFSLHIDNTKVPKGTVKVVWGTTEADPDTKDWNVNLKVNDKDDKTFKIKINNDIVYTLDCSALVCTPKD